MKVLFQNIRMVSGELIITPEKESVRAAQSIVRESKGMMQLEVKPHRNRRSLDANAYAWVLINKLSDKTGIPTREVYIRAIEGIGGNYDVLPIREDAVERFRSVWESRGIGWPVRDLGKSKLPGYRNLICYYGSSTYNGKQMSMLIDSLAQDCKAVGVETLSPEKLSSMMETYHEE